MRKVDYTKSFDPLLPVLAAVLFAIVVFLLSPAANAATRVARSGADQAVFTDEPCTDPKVTRHLTPEMAAQMRAATVKFQGQTYSACYVELDQGFALQFEDGDTGAVSRRDLVPSI